MTIARTAPPAPVDCAFCLSNGLLKGEIMAETPEGYLIPNQSNPGDFLIVPRIHVEDPAKLPDDWWKTMSALLPRIPESGHSYNISLNLGQEAGQSIKHLHFWVIPRPAHTPASGKGLARLIDEANWIQAD